MMWLTMRGLNSGWPWRVRIWIWEGGGGELVVTGVVVEGVEGVVVVVPLVGKEEGYRRMNPWTGEMSVEPNSSHDGGRDVT